MQLLIKVFLRKLKITIKNKNVKLKLKFKDKTLQKIKFTISFNNILYKRNHILKHTLIYFFVYIIKFNFLLLILTNLRNDENDFYKFKTIILIFENLIQRH